MKRKLLGLALLATTLPALQGCFPLAVTGMGTAAVVATEAAHRVLKGLGALVLGRRPRPVAAGP